MPKNHSYSSLAYKEKQRISHLGPKNGMYGRKRSDELIEKMREGNNLFWKNAFNRKRMSENNSDKMKIHWKNPKLRKAHLDAIFNTKFPTFFEEKIKELNKEFNLGFEYVGNGKKWIGNKNPDFIHKDFKIVIEVFYSWFKIRDYGSVENYKEFCKQKYESFGWMVIFIDERALIKKDWKNRCLNIIKITINNYIQRPKKIRKV